VRCDNLNNFVDSAPCDNCLSVILTLKIKRLVFSSKNNTIISIKPINLEINHKSAGTKFLEKKLKGSDIDSESDSDSDSKKKNNSKNKCKNNSKKQ
tara:strand:+ start:2682 stop:2969 length:288 start_codon:yes stop_codon:yes gene_type:complete